MHLQTQQWLDPTLGGLVGKIGDDILCLPPMEKESIDKGLNDQSEILNSIRGQKVNVPDIHQMFEGWPMATNIHLNSLRPIVDADLDKFFPAGKRRSKFKTSDFGLFAAMWWPTVSLERLCIATYIGLWLFAWDDEMDSTEYSDLTKNWQEAQAFRAKTLEATSRYLELDSQTTLPDTHDPQTALRSSILELFAPVGHAMVKHYTLDQRQTLMREIDLFVEMCGVEQLQDLSGQLPSVDTFNRYRRGTSAVGICLAVHEYTLEMRLPPHVMQNPLMKVLWDQTNIIVSVTNDIFSLKKEIASNQIVTLIPLLYVTHNHDLQAAMDAACEIVRNAITTFDLTAKSLLAEYADDPTISSADLLRFIESCQYACTGNIYWSLHTGRYGIQDLDLHGGATLQI